MGVLGLIWGIFAMMGMLFALIPLLGWLNWVVIPFSIIGIINVANGDEKELPIIGGIQLVK